MIVIHEFGFYETHKIMQIYSSWYEYHKVDHEHNVSNVIAAQHYDPIDDMCNNTIPGLIPTLIVQPHSFVMFG